MINDTEDIQKFKKLRKFTLRNDFTNSCEN